MAKLTQKQRRFVDEYIISGNATQAAIKAGYAPKAAAQTGAENLKKPYIAKAIEDRNKQIASEKIMDMREAMERLSAIARGETTEERVTPQGDVVKIKPSHADQIRAIELIGKRNGAWTEKKEVELKVPTFVDDVPESDGDG